MAKAAGTQVLAGVPLFAGLSSTSTCKRIRDLAEPADYMAGASLVKEGTKGDAFFVILEGLAKVVGRASARSTADARRLLRRDLAAGRWRADRVGRLGDAACKVLISTGRSS